MFEIIDSNLKVYEKILDQILTLIKNEELKKGEKLPSEKSLTESLGVGRTSLKQALSSLEAMGIIESRHGGGHYIPEDDHIDINLPLTAFFFLYLGDEKDIVQIRYIIETYVVKIAAKKATQEDLDKLEAILNEMKTIKNSKERARINFDFHKTLVEIAENKLLDKIFESISKLILHQVELADGIDFYQNHVNLFEAIKEHDVDKSYKLMVQHFAEKYPYVDNFS